MILLVIQDAVHPAGLPALPDAVVCHQVSPARAMERARGLDPDLILIRADLDEAEALARQLDSNFLITPIAGLGPAEDAPRALMDAVDGWIPTPVGAEALAVQLRSLRRLAERTHALSERDRELRCVYGFSALVEAHGEDLPAILRGTADLLPPAWQYSEIACVRIALDDQIYTTARYAETPWQQFSPLTVHGERAGSITVGYMEPRPEADEGPFLKEERALLNAIAERLGRIVERIRTTDALRRERDLVNRVLETSPAGITMVDRTGTLIYANEYAEEVLGLTRSEITTRTYNDPAWRIAAVDGGPFPEEALPFQRLMETGEPVRDVRHTIEWPDGEQKILSINGAPLLDASGEIDRAVFALEDVTARIKARETLAHRARQLAALYDVSEEITGTLDLSEVTDRATHSLHTILGYHHVSVFLLDEAQGRVVLSSMVGRAAECFPEGHTQPLNQGMVGWVARHGTMRLANDVTEDAYYINHFPDVLTTRSELTAPIRIDEEIIGVLDVQSPERNSFDAHDVRMIKTLAGQVAVAIRNARLVEDLKHELRQRQRTESALRESERRYRLLAENTIDVIWRMNLEQTFTYVNPAIESLAGYTPAEWIGTRLRDHAAAESYAVMQASIEEAFEALPNSTGVILEAEILDKDGESVPVEITGRVLVDADGRPVALQGVTRDISERRAAEAELRRHAQAIRTSIDGIAILDEDERFVHLNEAEARMYGYESPEALIGKRWHVLYHPEERRRIEDKVLPDMWEAGHWRGEAVGRRVDGSTFPQEISLTTLKDGGLVAVVRDISDRKRAEHARQRSLRELQLINETIVRASRMEEPDAICELLADAVHRVNPGAYVVVTLYDPDLDLIIPRAWRGFGSILDRMIAILGRDPKRMAIRRDEMGKEARYFTSGKLERMPEGLTQLASGTISHSVGQILRRVMGIEAAYTVGFALEDEAYGGIILLPPKGEEVHFTSAIETLASHLSQVLHRRQAEQAVVFEQNLLRSLMDHTPDSIYFKDAEHRFVRVSRSKAEHLGVPRQQVIGKTDYDFYPEEEAAEMESDDDWVMTYEAPIVSKIEAITRPDGETRWMSVTKLPRRDAKGRIIGTLGISRDITEQREMEEALHQQERLAAVGQLAGGIAHDFNNLLASIILYAQLPVNRHPHLPPDVRRALGTILEESKRASQLVQQILDFSRNAMLKTEPLNLADFTEEVTGVLQRTIPESIRLRLELAPTQCVVEADPTRIQQVLVNLAVNARDAMPEGGDLRIAVDEITVGPDEEPPLAGMRPGRWARLTIADTGVGMSEEVQSHLFEPFFTTKGPGEGTGLGLSQVWGIVKQHDGAIDIESAPGKGTQVTICLPCRDGASRGDPETAVDLEAGEGESILLVEDAAELRVAVRDFFESLGYRVRDAANGEEALELARAEMPDLLITDIVMPQMGGKALLERIRALDPDVRAVAITGYIMETDLQALTETGFQDVVTKPFDIETLAATVRRVADAPRP